MSALQQSGSLSLENLERILMRLERLGDGSSLKEAFSQFLDVLIEGGLTTEASVWLLDGEAITFAASTEGASTPVETIEKIARGSEHQFHDESGRHWVLASHAYQTDQRVMLQALSLGAQTEAVASQQQEIMEGLAEIAGQIVLRIQFRQFREERRQTQLFEPLLDVLLRDASLTDAAGSVSRSLLHVTGADRVSILETHRGGTRVLAVAPAAEIDTRSVQLQRLITAIENATRRGEHSVQVIVGQSQEFEPDESILEYLDSASVRQFRMDISPASTNAANAVIVLDAFSVERPKLLDQANPLIDHALPTIQRLIDRENSGLPGFLHRLQTSRLTQKLGLATALGFVACLILFLVPARLSISVDGQLSPVTHQRIYAPSNGIIMAVQTKHRAAVMVDEELLTIRDPDLESRISELDGEIKTLTKQLAATGAVRTQLDRGSAEAAVQLSAKEDDLKIQIEGLNEQRDLLIGHREDLVVRSPIDGTVDRWDLTESLDGRPVNLGQYLMDVVDEHGGWELRLDIPDDVIGYVNAAQSKEPCPVVYRVRSDPEHEYECQLSWLANSTQLSEENTLAVSARCPLPSGQLNEPRAGSGVVAVIDCGPHSLGFVWFREVIEFAHRHLWLF